MLQLPQLSSEDNNRPQQGDGRPVTGPQRASAAAAAAALVSCGGGGPAIMSTGTAPASAECTGSCATANSFLSIPDVQQVIAQGVAEARARGALATIGVVDRVGNVLAVYRMVGAASRPVMIASQVDASGHAVVHTGLEGIQLPQ